LNIRKLKKEDLKVAEKWWESWPKWKSPSLDFLPDTGIVVEKNNLPVVIGFIYLTNAKVALLEWIISDPEYRENDRDSLIELLIEGAENMVKHLEYKYLFSVCQHEKLIDKHKKLGWVIDKSPSHEMTKILK
jgi:hypothetical protein